MYVSIKGYSSANSIAVKSSYAKSILPRESSYLNLQVGLKVTDINKSLDCVRLAPRMFHAWTRDYLLGLIDQWKQQK